MRKEADDVGPRAELEHWKKRMAKFNSLLTHIKGQECRTVVGVLSAAKSKSLRVSGGKTKRDSVRISFLDLEGFGCSHNGRGERGERQREISLHVGKVLRSLIQERSGTRKRVERKGGESSIEGGY